MSVGVGRSAIVSGWGTARHTGIEAFEVCHHIRENGLSMFTAARLVDSYSSW